MALPSTLATKTARAADAALTTFSVGMVDMSGTGVGPFLPVHLAIGADGSPQVPALDATLQEVVSALQSPPQGGSVTVSNQISGFALDGTDATGVTAPAGGAGIRGWLSGIYAALTGTLKVDGSAVTQPVSVAGTLKTAPQAGAPATAFTDRSGTTSATAGSFTQLAAANTARQYLRVTNTSTSATLFLWDKSGTPAQAGCIPIPPGAGYVFDAKVSNTVLQIAASAASISYEAAEG